MKLRTSRQWLNFRNSIEISIIKKKASSTKKKYTDEEIQYFRNIAREYLYIYSSILKKKGKNFLDVGCGEGWNLGEFHKGGWDISGCDFSKDGISYFNPHLLPFFTQGDLNQLIPSITKKFDLIVLKNVLEHVIDPEESIKNLNGILADDGVLLVVVPNDFSFLQNYLFKNKFISREYWVVAPDHLTYFTHETLSKFMGAQGFRLLHQSTDYPIDFDLLVPERNYIDNPAVGKYSHLQRVRTENFMMERSIESTVKHHGALADMGLGRSVVNFFAKK